MINTYNKKKEKNKKTVFILLKTRKKIQAQS